MSTPQQNEVRRSTHNAADPDAPASALTAASPPTEGSGGGPVPEDNKPGHHPEVEQDKPAVVQDRQKH